MSDYSEYLYQVNGNTYTLKDIEKLAYSAIDSIDKIKAEYERSSWLFEKLESAVLDEEYEDTIERLYRKGHSEALAMVLGLLEGQGN
jgi:hypothetical protein